MDWKYVSMNEKAIELLRENKDKIDWKNVSKNPAIFTYDYDAIYKRIAPLKEELMSVVHHPQNIPCFYALGFDEDKLLPYNPMARIRVLIPKD
jgi:hypothetical protein